MKKTIISAVYTILALLLGYLASVQVNGFLGIKYKTKPGIEEMQNTGARPDTSDIRPLQLRLADLGGVGILPDSANWGNNYEHNVHRFEDLILEGEPYLDPAAYRRIGSELDTYLNQMQSYGINGIVLPGFLELVSFEDWPAGRDIYSGSDNYPKRHKALQEGFGKWIRNIADRGMEVYLYTDMVALTPPLEKFLMNRYGKMDTGSDEFWDVYKAACEEVFTRLPEVSGIVIRIGEAGSIYNKPGWDYYSELAVRTDKSLEKMLSAFLEVAEKHNKKIIFRTWSVGVGQIGDMHTNAETYQRVLGNIHSKSLVVSTKYSRGDFYSWLPFNETLLQGEHRRIAEFQLRREFEGFNAFPNYMGPLYQKALLRFTQQNKNFDGVWLWTQEGGPLRAGPLSIYPLHGFNTVTDLNVYAMSRLVNNPSADILNITFDWAGLYFGTDSVVQKTITDVFMGSHATTQKGLYIGPFARYDVRALGLEPPPMLWIFEWDIVGGSPSVFSNIYFVSRDSIQGAINEGYEAAAEAGRMLANLREVSGRVNGDNDRFNALIASVGYEQNLFTTLAHFRKYMLSYYEWLDRGSGDRKKIWTDALKQYVQAEQAHTKTYTGNLDFPSYNFREANVAAKIAGRTTTIIWLARILGLIFILAILLGIPGIQRKLPPFRGSRAVAMLWYGLVNPSGSGGTSCARADTAPLGLFSFAYLTLSLLAFTSFVAPVFVTSLMVLSVLYVAVNLVIAAESGNCDQVAKGVSLLSPAVAFMGLIMLFTAWRGPVAFWYFFWTSASFRVVFMLMFVLFVMRAYYTWTVTLNKALGLGPLRTAGTLSFVQGLLFLTGGGLVSYFGFEKVLTVLNDELMLLPGGLSRILGITTHLEIPTGIPTVVMYLGIALLLAGGSVFVLLLQSNKKKWKSKEK